MLVVDDDASIRLLCRVNLELDGFRVLEANCVDEARSVLADGSVDAVLLDVHVGNDDGVAFLAELKRAQPALGVAMLTGTVDADRILGEGADAIIRKPFTLDELKETVERLSEHGR